MEANNEIIRDEGMGGNINMGKVRLLQRKIDSNGVLIDNIVNRLVNEYCTELDEYMTKIKNILNDPINPPSNLELDDFTLNLPVLLYFTGQAQEALGVKEDVAKAFKLELYNEVYGQATGTVADKTAEAEQATQNEYIAHIAYQRAYKKIKLRMDAANETLQSIKKVMTRRMSEFNTSNIDSGRGGF